MSEYELSLECSRTLQIALHCVRSEELPDELRLHGLASKVEFPNDLLVKLYCNNPTNIMVRVCSPNFHDDPRHLTCMIFREGDDVSRLWRFQMDIDEEGRLGAPVLYETPRVPLDDPACESCGGTLTRAGTVWSCSECGTEAGCFS